MGEEWSLPLPPLYRISNTLSHLPVLKLVGVETRFEFSSAILKFNFLAS